MPGGESTTVPGHLHRRSIVERIREHVATDRPVLATGTGLIVTARDARDDRVDELGLVDVTVDRNAFGRQAAYEAPLGVTGSTRRPRRCSSAR